jgi:transcriptional regulator with XRE-family HTH domain
MPEASKPFPGDVINGLIAGRVGQLRKSRSMSFDALATRSEISKGMLVAIEQGRANPSIGTLCKLAAALRVSLSELVAEASPRPLDVQVVPPDQTSVLWEGPKGGFATLLVGSAGPDMLELWEWQLSPGEMFKAKKHGNGTVELLLVTEGALALEVDGIDYLVPTNHRAIAKTDKPHSYSSHGGKRTRFSMVVYEPESR